MKFKDRVNKVQELYILAEKNKLNKFTLAFLFANYNDREFLKFYSEFKTKYN